MKFLIIQTAFIGDVILATAVAEKLHQHYPDAVIDFVIRKGNEGLLANHPFISQLYIWDKRQNKFKNLFFIIKKLRAGNYDYTINLHRFTSSGFITVLSGAKYKIGFDKNPLSFLFTKRVKHQIAKGKQHEVERNQLLIQDITDQEFTKPKLYPAEKHFSTVNKYKNNDYICIAPTSVWYTKQFPKEKWVELCNLLPDNLPVYLLGAENDVATCNWIKNNTINKTVINLAGKLNFLESAALMQDAIMNYVNDSAPMHIASAMNAPVTAIFCSTIPDFGFGPLSSNSKIIETTELLDCRPCGLHGYQSCPKGHFKCALTIKVNSLFKSSKDN